VILRLLEGGQPRRARTRRGSRGGTTVICLECGNAVEDTAEIVFEDPRMPPAGWICVDCVGRAPSPWETPS